MAIRSKKILIVDDDELIRDCCVEILTNSGYTVETASNGMQAIERLSAETYDLVISDVNMRPRRHGALLSVLHRRT